jgi:hypothetical protein
MGPLLRVSFEKWLASMLRGTLKLSFQLVSCYLLVGMAFTNQGTGSNGIPLS